MIKGPRLKAEQERETEADNATFGLACLLLFTPLPGNLQLLKKSPKFNGQAVKSISRIDCNKLSLCFVNKPEFHSAAFEMFSFNYNVIITFLLIDFFNYYVFYLLLTNR